MYILVFCPKMFEFYKREKNYKSHFFIIRNNKKIIIVMNKYFCFFIIKKCE